MTPRVGAFGVSLAAVLAALPCFAQSEPAPPSAPAGGPATQAHGAVVVADPFPDETDNARLRAKVYAVLRDKGYTPDSKADVDSAARDAGALKDGRISEDASGLEVVRRQLGLGLLVRISKGPNGLAILAVREGDIKSTTAASADEAPARVGELLSGKSNASAAPIVGGSLSAGFITDRPKKEEQPDLTDPKQLEKAWAKRGGLRVSYGASALATGLIIPKTPYGGQNPVTGELEVQRKTTYGVGGGVGLHLSLMYVPVPTPQSGATSWAAFRVGAAFELSGLYVRPPKEIEFKTQGGAVVARDTKYANDADLYGVLPLQIGVHFGFGDFRLPTLWRGLVLGIAYSPAWIFSLDLSSSNSEVSSQFNYGGFELSLDVAKLEAERGSQPQLRLFALVLPRVKDDLPWLASAGIGAIWY